jgi:signal transduction histidine kinase
MSMRAASRALLARLPPTTVRARLTFIYGGLFLPVGVVVLAITYAIVARLGVTRTAVASIARVVPFGQSGSAGTGSPGAGGTESAIPAGPRSVQSFITSQHVSDLHTLLLASGVALAVMVVLAFALSWLFAGRVLRPLRAMTSATQQISEHNLHERLAMRGPRDELKELGDTIDGLLGRLQGAFDAQRRFAANASHELRTPLTVSRALLEMTLADPDATVESFKTTCRQVLEEGEQQEQLIEALLVLALSQRGLDRREEVDLAQIAGEVVRAQQSQADARGLRLDALLAPAVFTGDPRLAQRLVANLVDNALRHNVRNGRVEVAVENVAGHATLVVTNTGPRVPEDQVQRLLRPFQRLAPERTGQDGVGLGLSIVQAIADAHDATLTADAQPDGGLRIVVSFP